MGFLNFVKSFGSSGARSGVLSDASREQVSARTLGDEFPADAKFFGLENFGNTCYCNSVLQALYACEPFRERLIEHNVESARGGAASTSGAKRFTSSSAPESMLQALGDLFQEISLQTKRTGYLAPKAFIERLRKDNVLFRGHMHQDAHEFLNFLLNECCENLESELKRAGEWEPGKKTWIHDVFEGKLANQTRCLWCENTTNREECFLDLSVDVAQNTSITACLNNFSAKELLDKNDKFQCDRCGGLHEAQKRMLIQSAPRVLSLHLKRFKYIETLGRHAKLNHRVVFSSELKIPNMVDEHPDEASYNLFAVVVHIGSGPNHGHYVCFAKNNNRWFLFDDDCVEVVDEEQLHRVFGSTTEAGGAGSEHGYMLFFARNEESDGEEAEAIPFTIQ